ncbi:MAG: magnesium transporter [Alphaproteobacteria bacterium]|nr:magnesium transporter [Alphaproteobacteria bacterium]
MTDPREQSQTDAASTQEEYGLNPELVKSISEALEQDNEAAAKQQIDPLHAADIADLIDVMDPELRPRLVDIIRENFDPAILMDVDANVREELLDQLGVEKSAEALSQLETDEAVSVIEELPEEDKREILDAVTEDYRSELEEGLSYPEGSAGRLMRKKVVRVPEYWTVGDAIDFLREQANLPNDFYQIFVTSPQNHPVGGVLLSRIIRSQRNVMIRDLMDTELRPVRVDMDQEEAAFLFRKYGLVSAPVVSADGQMVGMLTIDDIVEVIEEEASEDLMHLGGVKEGDIFSDVGDTVRSRFPWLFVNFMTAIVSASVIYHFSGTIEKIVALAVLMPIVASMGGNAGTQSITVAVRSIATKELSAVNARRVIGKEMLVGTINGMLLAAIAGVATYYWYGKIMLSLIFAAAIVINLTIAGLFGALIPVTLNRLKVDPAIASGIFLTTCTDAIGFLVFLGIATAVFYM